MTTEAALIRAARGPVVRYRRHTPEQRKAIGRKAVAARERSHRPNLAAGEYVLSPLPALEAARAWLERNRAELSRAPEEAA